MSNTDGTTSPEFSAEPAVQAPHVIVDVIETREAYLAAVEELAAGHGPIAIDAERASGYRYSQRAYLIQVYRRGSGTFLFDPPAIGSMVELNAASEVVATLSASKLEFPWPVQIGS